MDDILLDLNEKERKTILEIAKSFINKEETTVIYATKDEKTAKELTSRTIKLKLGSIENEE